MKKRALLNRSRAGNAITFFILALLGVFMILPMYLNIINSLKPLEELWTFPPRFYVVRPTLDNFKTMFTMMSQTFVPFSRYVFNTFFISVVGTTGHVVIASMAAYCFAKHEFYGSKVMFGMIVYSLMFSTAVTAIPNYLVVSKLGMMDSYWAIIVPAFSSSLGLYLMKNFMESMVPDTILEAARIDGLGEWGMLWKMVMPTVKPAWLTLVIFSFKDLWNMPNPIFIQTEKYKSLNYAIGQIVTGGFARAGVGAAASVFMMVMPIAIFLITQSNVVETMATSGMKD